MSDQLRAHLRVRGLIADEPSTDDPSDPRARLRRTCRAAVRGLEVDGAGICLWSSEHAGLATVAASDERSSELEDLQFLVGEGPCLSSFSARAPVLVPDLDDVAALPWVAYPDAARRLGARAVFAFPIQLGEARLGVLDLYRDAPHMLAPEAVALALSFAEITFLDLLEVAEDDDELGALADGVAANRYEVFQAQGMVMVQLGISSAEALLRIRVHAFAHDRRLADLARDIVQHRVVIPGHDEGDR